MKFSVEWRDDGENASAEERATLCELKISVGGENACLFIDAKQQSYDALLLPAVHLAEGIAHDWWRIFGARDRKHSLPPYRTGFVLPALQFGCDGATFEVEGQAAHYDNPGVRFWPVDGERCPRSVAERELAGFVDGVVERLASKAVEDCGVALAWQQVRASRADPAEAAFCEAAGALGINPYAVDDEDATFIEQASELFEGEALIEFLAGGVRDGATTFSNRVSTVSWLQSLESRRPYECRLPALAEISQDFGPDAKRGNQEPAWSQDYRVATMLASKVRVDGRARATPEALAKRFGADSFQRVHADAAEPGIRAVVSRSRIHLRDRGRGKHKWAAQAETFALARAIGSALCFSQTSRRVVNGLHDAEEQSVGRAFAAQFLAPVEKIVDMKSEGLEEYEIAQEFQVSEQVVAHQLQNQERIAAAQGAV